MGESKKGATVNFVYFPDTFDSMILSCQNGARNEISQYCLWQGADCRQAFNT